MRESERGIVGRATGPRRRLSAGAPLATRFLRFSFALGYSRAGEFSLSTLASCMRVEAIREKATSGSPPNLSPKTFFGSVFISQPMPSANEVTMDQEEVMP